MENAEKPQVSRQNTCIFKPMRRWDITAMKTMKKTLFILLVIFASQVASAKTIPAGYVDLGLPSGTLWKASDEPALFTYYAALRDYGTSLPTRAQFKELIRCCTWRWTGKGCRATGPNGNTIYFPFDGYADCDDNLRDVGVSARIWTIDAPDPNSEWAFYCAFLEDFRDIVEDAKCYSVSVRLVISE